MLSIKDVSRGSFGECVSCWLISQSFSFSSFSLSFLSSSSSAPWRVLRTFSPLTEGVVDEVEWAVVAWMGGLLPLRQPLHEMDLALVLACPWALPWPPTACEGHIPALVAGIPQCCIVVLQDDLGEDTVTALSIFLQTHRHTEKQSVGMLREDFLMENYRWEISDV